MTNFNEKSQFPYPELSTMVSLLAFSRTGAPSDSRSAAARKSGPNDPSIWWLEPVAILGPRCGRQSVQPRSNLRVRAVNLTSGRGSPPNRQAVGPVALREAASIGSAWTLFCLYLLSRMPISPTKAIPARAPCGISRARLALSKPLRPSSDSDGREGCASEFAQGNLTSNTRGRR